jgi:hypothetical protein
VILWVARKILAKEHRAPYNALEFAIWDFWARIVSTDLTSFIFPAEALD